MQARRYDPLQEEADFYLRRQGGGGGLTIFAYFRLLFQIFQHKNRPEGGGLVASLPPTPYLRPCVHENVS